MDAVVVVYVPPVATAGLAHAAALRAAAAGSETPVVTTFLAVDGLPEHLAVPGPDGAAARGSVPSFRTPERAVAALAHAARYGAWRARPPGTVPTLPDVDRKGARAAVDAMRGADPTSRDLSDDEVTDLLGRYGIRIAEFRSAENSSEAVAAASDLGYPVALKASDEAQRHRPDQAGVRVALNTAAQVAAAYDVLRALAGPRVYVQRMAAPGSNGVSTEFGISADPSFGALVSFGIGGLAIELLDDRAYRAVPLTDVDALELIGSPRAAPILDGYRGSSAVAREPLADIAIRLSALADDLPEVTALRLRPVLAGPQGVTVAGAVGRIGAPPERPDLRRRLS